MKIKNLVVVLGTAAFMTLAQVAHAQLIDNNQAPNTAKAGINKSLANEIGPGRGDLMTPNSSLFIITRDPFRSVRRGRQIPQGSREARITSTVSQVCSYSS